MMQARDLYVKQTVNGKTLFSYHRVWDAQKFLGTLEKTLKSEDESSSISVVTKEEYKNGTH